MKSLLAALFVAATVVGATEAPGIKVERIFGPEVPGRYKHPACIEQLANGDFYLVYYGGTSEYSDDTAVYGSRLAQGATQWTPPAVIADTPDRSEGNAVIWQAPDGTAWLFYVVRYGATWSTSRIQAKISRDGARTWSDPVMLAFEEGMMVRSRPIALADGDYLLPIYHETGTDTEAVGAESTSLFLRYEVKQRRWVETNRIRSRIGNIQPAVVQISNDYLISYSRRGGDYKPRTDGFLVRSESRDGGRTWSPGQDSTFPNPNAAADFIRLRNGHLLLVYNDSMRGRTPLTVAISTDSDRSYPYKRNIAEGRGDFAYPTAIQARDGQIHVIFTSNGRTVVNRAVFPEEAITGGAK
jgi:predicted neuraminidase